MKNNLSAKSIASIWIVSCIMLLSAGTVLHMLTLKEKESLRAAKEAVFASNAEDVVVLKQSVQHLSPQISQVESYFIDHADAPGFIGRLESIAAQAGIEVVIENIDVAEMTRPQAMNVDGKAVTEEKRTYGDLAMSMRAQGSWQGIMVFLTTIEQLDKKLVVEGLRLSSVADSESGQVSWSAIFNLRGLTD